MRVLRVLLATILAIIGGILGYQFGHLYVDLLKRTPLGGADFSAQLAPVSIAGFAAIGVLVGLLAYSVSINQVQKLAGSFSEMPANDKIALVTGALLGVIFTVLLSPILSQIRPIGMMLTLVAGIVLVYVGIQGMMSMKQELRKLFPPYGAVVAEEPEGLQNAKLLDTNIIIDGRISDICRAGFIDGAIYVPGFVLDELQLIADSGDSLKRARGRRGLEILNQMQKEFDLIVRSFDHMSNGSAGEPVDSKLVALAKAMKGTVVTNDYNLNKVAELQGVRVLNVNELANALKPIVLPGEDLTVNVIKQGKEAEQGIAYLDDGTMVVVEGARRHIGETVPAVVTSVLQTVAGKMIFANLKEVADQEEELIDRNLRNYYGGRGRRGGGGGRQ